MLYDCALRKTVERIFFKLAKKNPKQFETCPYRSKVCADLLVDNTENLVIIEDYNHHDKIYKR